MLCGDATNRDDVRRLMDGKHAALFQTDPPYLVDYTGADRPNDSGKDWSDRYHEVEIKDAQGFFEAVFANALAVTAPQAAWYCWHAHKRAAWASGGGAAGASSVLKMPQLLGRFSMPFGIEVTVD